MLTKPRAEDNLFKFSEVFTPFLWAIIVALIVVHATIFHYFQEWHGHDGEALQPSSVWIGAFSHFVMGTPKLYPKRMFLQMLNVGFCFCVCILGNTYTANLASILISSSNSASTINDIVDANRQRIKLCVVSGSNAQTTLSTGYTGIRAVIQPVYAALGLAAGQCTGMFLVAADFDIAVTRQSMNPGCNLAKVGGVVREVSYAMGMKMDYSTYCTSFMGMAMAPYFLALQANGFIDQAWQDALAAKADLVCPPEPVKALALGADDMKGVFVLYAICVLICIVVWALDSKVVSPTYAMIMDNGKTITLTKTPEEAYIMEDSQGGAGENLGAKQPA
jgi:hypothetical protein